MPLLQLGHAHTLTNALVLADDEMGKMATMRNLWSAHIFTLEKDICDLIGLLCGSWIVPLKRLLQRVSLQLSDLSAPIAVFVVKAVLDTMKKNFGENSDVAKKISDFLQTLLLQVPVCCVSTTCVSLLLITRCKRITPENRGQ